MPFDEKMKWNMEELLKSKKINKHWIFSKNELFLNQQYNLEKRVEQCKNEWKGVSGEDHFYFLNEFSVLRRLNKKNNPIISILTELIKHNQKT